VRLVGYQRKPRNGTAGGVMKGSVKLLSTRSGLTRNGSCAAVLPQTLVTFAVLIPTSVEIAAGLRP
jgi:hypothetical protein